MIMVVVLECRASSGPGDVVVTPREAPRITGAEKLPSFRGSELRSLLDARLKET
jgi:hypothetical protein